MICVEWLSRRLIVILPISILAACAGRQVEVQDTNPGLALPEVRKVLFTGNKTFNAGSLRGAMASKQRPVIFFWKRGDSYNRPTLDADLKRLKKYYFDQGYLQAEANVETVDKNSETNEVRIMIAIEEGNPTLIQSIQLVDIPPELPPQPKIMLEFPLQVGDRISKSAFESSKTQLLELMQKNGYARARVLPKTAVDTEAHRADITLTLQPGEKTAFGNFTISGNELVREHAIRRQLEVATGDIYNPKRLKRSNDNIYGMGMFRAVTPSPVNLEADGNPPLEMSIDIRERKPKTFQVGLGASSIERFRFRLSWTHRNFFGSAESLTLTGRLGSFEQRAEAKLRLPFFLYRRTSFTQTVFVQNEQEFNTDPLGLLDTIFNIEDPQPGYDLLSLGSISRVDHRLTDHLTASVGLELSYHDFRNVSDGSEEDTEDNLLFIQFAELLYDTSNSFLNPTRGILLRGRLDHSTISLISDVNFVKLRFESRYYWPIWWRLIFATRLVLGSIQPYGDTDNIPPNVRFFAGGPGSMRGYVRNRVGPLTTDNDPEGGNSLMIGSFELRFPIVGDLWGTLFLDYGNVFPGAFNYDLNDLRYAVGPGIRYLSPIGPIRFDVGFIVNPRTDEEYGRVDFSIGQAF